MSRRFRTVIVPALMAGVLLAPALLFAQETTTARPAATVQTIAGGELFKTYCVSCHGSSARGDGALAGSMRRKPADLTRLAERNGGEYPAEMVHRTIDGKQPVRGHGGPDMPEWGDAFLRSRDGGTPETVRQTIASIVVYLETLQVKTVH